MPENEKNGREETPFPTGEPGEIAAEQMGPSPAYRAAFFASFMSAGPVQLRLCSGEAGGRGNSLFHQQIEQRKPSPGSRPRERSRAVTGRAGRGWLPPPSDTSRNDGPWGGRWGQTICQDVPGVSPTASAPRG